MLIRRDDLDFYRPVGEPVLKLSKWRNGYRHEHDDLLVVINRNKGSSHSNFRFTKPDITANHGLGLYLILHHCGNLVPDLLSLRKETGGEF